MKRGVDEIRTTHTGSLPRPTDLIRMMFVREEGVPVDGPRWSHEFAPRWPRVDRKQTDPGISVVRCR